MERMLTNTGSTGRENGRPAVCPRVWDIVPGAGGRNLPFGRET
jgi:hypothetical protein